MIVLQNMKKKKINTASCAIFALFLLLPFMGFTQNRVPLDSLHQKLTNAAKEIMTSAKTCALITIDQEGNPRVRTMDHFAPEIDFTVWFGTNPKSRKVYQIKQNPSVTLYYLANDGSGYVTIHGEAEIVNNQEEKEKRWKVAWEAFYPNKSEDFALIKVTPHWMEVVSYAHGVVGDPITWEPPRVIFN
jgi:general stress protein 26